MPFDEDQPRDDKGMWTAGDAGNAIREAASDKIRQQYTGMDVKELVKLKKKLFSNMDITSPMSNEEKILNEVVAKKFSDINAQIRIKRNA